MSNVIYVFLNKNSRTLYLLNIKVYFTYEGIWNSFMRLIEKDGFRYFVEIEICCKFTVTVLDK